MTAAEAIAERLAEALRPPFELGEPQPYTCTASIGLALSNSRSTPESLVRDADTAMYRAEEHGRVESSAFKILCGLARCTEW